jgi:Fe-S cluster biogenesis protein NfuA
MTQKGTMETDNMRQRIEEVLDTMRPFLKADGGDVEFIAVQGRTVQLRLLGACSSCNMSNMTMKAGIEEGIKKAIPEIEAVEAIN